MKVDLLGAVANQGEVEAREVATVLGMSPPAAAMALLRAYRAGLLARAGGNGGVGFTYTLTDKGWLRLHHLSTESLPSPQPRPRNTVNHMMGGHDVRTSKLYSGTYHCPQCQYEVALKDEGSVRCEDCSGRLHEGPLPEDDSWDDEDEDDD